MKAKELRDMSEEEAVVAAQSVTRVPIYFILEDVLDTYNIGGLFRLADALAISKMYLCGDCEVPPNHKIKKASVGTYKVVPWEYKETAKAAIDILRDQYAKDLQVVAIEQDSRSKDYRNIIYRSPVVFIAGNETDGVKKQTLDICNSIAEIPMRGTNTSLNVIVATSIVSYYAIDQLQKT